MRRMKLTVGKISLSDKKTMSESKETTKSKFK